MAVMRALKFSGVQSNVVTRAIPDSIYPPIILDAYYIKNMDSLYSIDNAIHNLRSRNWYNHFLILYLRTEFPSNHPGTIPVFSLNGILEALSFRLLPLNDYELEDAKQQALPAILEKWLHDLKSNKKVTVSRVFCEIKETVADTIYGGLSVSKTDILKSIANKDAVNLQATLSTIKDSIERDGG